MSATRTFILGPEPHVELESIRQDSDWFTPSEVALVVVDLGRVHLLDSILIGHLVKMRLNLRNREIEMRLENLNHQARQVLYVSNLDGLFGITVQPPRWEE